LKQVQKSHGNSKKEQFKGIVFNDDLKSSNLDQEIFSSQELKDDLQSILQNPMLLQRKYEELLMQF
jgi:hypothetical protein